LLNRLAKATPFPTFPHFQKKPKMGEGAGNINLILENGYLFLELELLIRMTISSRIIIAKRAEMLLRDCLLGLASVLENSISL